MGRHTKIFNVGENSFNVVQGVTKQRAHATWFRGEHCNYSSTKAALDDLQEHRAEAAIVFTLSPIPLHATFRPISCMTANAVSKATLRVELDELQTLMETFEAAYCS